VDVKSDYDTALEMHFDFVVFPLVHPRAMRDPVFAGKGSSRGNAFTRSDLLLSTEDWSRCVVGEISEWIGCAIDSTCPAEAKAAEHALGQEVRWSQHLSVPAILAPFPSSDKCENYARCLNQALNQYAAPYVWMLVPLSREEHDVQAVDEDIEEDEEFEELMPLSADNSASGSNDKGWNVWNRVRLLCDHHNHLGVCLKLTKELPQKWCSFTRWLGEPVKACMLPTSLFELNEAGFPVLATGYQKVLLKLIEHDVQIILTGRAKHAKGVLPYLQYLHHLKTRIPEHNADEANMRPYYDYLQEPLQPLFHNLESATYNIFESCPVKYVQYERAIERCLRDRQSASADVVRIMVVGAGRGPLVKCALRAAETCQQSVVVHAVEKNPNAVVTLECMFASYENVHVVLSDMREYDPPEKADILVSELLGSFGDNELSPECLDGAQRFLRDDGNGISIPASSKSYLAPITTSKLWGECKRFKDIKHFETPYVVRLFNFDELSPSKACFYFEHPNLDPVIDNRRSQRISFRSKCSALCHGFAGYFECMLYDEVAFSIRPETNSEGMTSWFPVYFPIASPFRVEEGTVIEVMIWRCVGESKVWYEWCITKPFPSVIHNVNGRSSWIGM
jgi:protein arginine N-methyltransferase 5